MMKPLRFPLTLIFIAVMFGAALYFQALRFNLRLSWQHKGLTLGAWASQDFAGTYNEADLYASYNFNFGLSLGITDYYYPGLEYFDFSDTTGSHAYEINLGYTIGKLSLAANYVLNQAGGAASAGGDTYVELKYDFKHFGLFAGVGNGWLTIEDPGKVTNLGW